LPVWLDQLESGQRLRASVKLRGDDAVLDVPTRDGFIFKRDATGWQAAENLKKFLTAHRLRLSPRALTLTMFLRLIVCDQFVHGIGGALYDELTDRLLRKRLKMDAPAFCVTTATLLFPSAVERKRVDLPALMNEGRRLRHGTGDDEKMKLVEQIERSPRGSPQRSRLFYQMHARLADVRERPDFVEWERRVEQARQREAEESDLFDRELFYAIQPRERLTGLIERYSSELK